MKIKIKSFTLVALTGSLMMFTSCVKEIVDLKPGKKNIVDLGSDEKVINEPADSSNQSESTKTNQAYNEPADSSNQSESTKTNLSYEVIRNYFLSKNTENPEVNPQLFSDEDEFNNYLHPAPTGFGISNTRRPTSVDWKTEVVIAVYEPSSFVKKTFIPHGLYVEDGTIVFKYSVLYGEEQSYRTSAHYALKFNWIDAFIAGGDPEEVRFEKVDL